jgi:hypothetical protein
MRIPDMRLPLRGKERQTGKLHSLTVEARGEREAYAKRNSSERVTELSHDLSFARQDRSSDMLISPRSATVGGSRTNRDDAQNLKDPATLAVLPRRDHPDIIPLRLGLLPVVIVPRDVLTVPEVLLRSLLRDLLLIDASLAELKMRKQERQVSCYGSRREDNQKGRGEIGNIRQR